MASNGPFSRLALPALVLGFVAIVLYSLQNGNRQNLHSESENKGAPAVDGEQPKRVEESLFSDSLWRKFEDEDNRQREEVKSEARKQNVELDDDRPKPGQLRQRFLGEQIKASFKRRGQFSGKLSDLSPTEMAALKEWHELQIKLATHHFKKSPEPIDGETRVSFNADGMNNDRVKVNTEHFEYSF